MSDYNQNELKKLRSIKLKGIVERMHSTLIGKKLSVEGQHVNSGIPNITNTPRPRTVMTYNMVGSKYSIQRITYNEGHIEVYVELEADAVHYIKTVDGKEITSKNIPIDEFIKQIETNGDYAHAMNYMINHALANIKINLCKFLKVYNFEMKIFQVDN